METDPSPDPLVLRYLAAFGPASASDFGAWSGLIGAQSILERLRPQLRSYRDDRGRELFDVPDGLLPDPHTAAPPRFVPEFDNVLIAYADRRRIIPQRHHGQVIANLGEPMLLVDGFVAGFWRVTRDDPSATLQLRLLEPIRTDVQEAIAAEGNRLLNFLASEAPTREIVFDATTSAQRS